MDLHGSRGFIRYICRWRPCDGPLLRSYTLATHICTLALLKYFQASDLEELRKTSAFPISLFLSLSLPLLTSLSHRLTSSFQVPSASGHNCLDEWGTADTVLSRALSFYLSLSPPLSLFCPPFFWGSGTSDHSGASSLHSSLSLSPSCALLVECYLVCCVLLACFLLCSGTIGWFG